MSTKKDGLKTSSSNVPQKKVATVSKTSTRNREDSTDRSDVKKTEVSNRIKKPPASVTNIRDKIVDSSRIKTKTLKPATKSEKPLKVPPAISKSSNDIKKAPSTISKMVPKRKSEVPATPPSSRISRTQFFPSKDMYSHALKTTITRGKDTASSSREKSETRNGESKTKIISSNRGKTESRNVERKTKTSSKKNTVAKEKTIRTTVNEEVKSKEPSSDSSSVSERPSTATLRKGSIVHDNIAGPDAPRPLIPKVIKEVSRVKTPSPKSEASDEYKYEDDFDSYESDFEVCSSSSSTNVNNLSGEETSSISSSSSSSNDDLTSPRELKTAQKRVNSASTDEERKLDSGNFDMPDFKHKQILYNIKESIEKENANLAMQDIQRNNPASLSDEGFEEQKSLGFINFLDAKRKFVHRKSVELKRRRGEEILNMIRLDTYSFTLFDLPPVPYEDFIKSYGKSNTVQAAIQTGEDNISEEVQTDEIVSASRWTQFPVSFSKVDAANPNFWQLYKSDYLGVGSDTIVEEKYMKKSFNESYLNKFLLSVGGLILKIQSESISENCEKIRKNSREIPFSDGYTLFNTTNEVFSNCSVTSMSFCGDDSNKVVTVHLKKNEDADENGSVVCLWNVSISEEPEAILISYGKITCCCFGLNSSDFIYAGLSDGTISVWNTKKLITSSPSSRIPSYTTEINRGHASGIVSLQPFMNSTEKKFNFQSDKTNEVCSLDEEGDIILWSLIIKEKSAKTVTITATSWSHVVLLKNTRISLKNLYPDLIDLQCTDFVINKVDSNHVFVSTNYGFIIHHLIKGGKSNVKRFLPESRSVANCLEMCPFSANYFLGGFADGNISLYSRLVEKPLMVLSDKEGKIDDSSIQLIQWSRNKPFVLYTKDISNTIHIWDLSESDIYPTYSIPFGKNITCMKLSPLVMDNSSRKSYLMIGTEDGNLYLHLLNSEHGQQTNEVYKEHVKTFLKYVNRL